MGRDPNWGRFWEHPALGLSQRELFERTRVALHDRLAALPTDPEHFGMIHADLHPGNLVVDDERLSVIDFDDAAFGWYLYDLAVALSHHQTTIDFPALRTALIAGYAAHRAFPDEDSATLELFLLVRRLATIGWMHQRPEVDAREYLATTVPLVVGLSEAFLDG